MKTSKRILSLLLSVVMVLGVCAVGITVSAEDSVYEIDSYAKLKEFASLVNGGQTGLSAKLTADITATDKEWVPIGNDSKKYIGTFNGCGHIIAGLSNENTDPKPDEAGLCGCIGKNGTVENLTVDSVDFTANYTGSIAGVNRGLISCCAGSGSITGAINAGGLVGYNNSTIENCYSMCSVKAEKHINGTGLWSILNYAGGIVGFQNDGLTKSCYNTGSVALDSTVTTNHQATVDGYVGGIAGCVNQGTVRNCYSCGSTSFNAEATAPNLTELHAFKGGVTGDIRHGEVQFCYYDNKKCDIPGAVNGADTDTAKGLITAQMTGTTAFDNMNGFTNDVWLVKESDSDYSYYPHLRGFAYDTNPVPENWPPKVASRPEPDLTVSVTPAEPVYGDAVTVTAFLPEDAEGSVTFFLDNAETGKKVDVSSGNAVCRFEGLGLYSHTVKAVYSGDSSYEDKTVTATFTVSSANCPLTINYVYANGGKAAETYTGGVEIFKNYSVTSPEITGYTPDFATVTGTMNDLVGVEVTVTYTAIIYTATFVDENGKTVGTKEYTVETKNITPPAVPEKAGYTGRWEDYTLRAGGITVKPVYTKNYKLPERFETQSAAYNTFVTVNVTLENVPNDAKVFIEGKEAKADGNRYSSDIGQVSSTRDVKLEVQQSGKVTDSATLKIEVNSTFFGKLTSFFTNFLFNLFRWKTVSVSF